MNAFVLAIGIYGALGSALYLGMAAVGYEGKPRTTSTWVLNAAELGIIAGFALALWWNR